MKTTRVFFALNQSTESMGRTWLLGPQFQNRRLEYHLILIWIDACVSILDQLNILILQKI